MRVWAQYLEGDVGRARAHPQQAGVADGRLARDRDPELHLRVELKPLVGDVGLEPQFGHSTQ